MVGKVRTKYVQMNCSHAENLFTFLFNWKFNANNCMSGRYLQCNNLAMLLPLGHVSYTVKKRIFCRFEPNMQFCSHSDMQVNNFELHVNLEHNFHNCISACHAIVNPVHCQMYRKSVHNQPLTMDN